MSDFQTLLKLLQQPHIAPKPMPMVGQDYATRAATRPDSFGNVGDAVKVPQAGKQDAPGNSKGGAGGPTGSSGSAAPPVASPSGEPPGAYNGPVNAKGGGLLGRM